MCVCVQEEGVVWWCEGHNRNLMLLMVWPHETSLPCHATSGDGDGDADAGVCVTYTDTESWPPNVSTVVHSCTYNNNNLDLTGWQRGR